MADRNTRGTTTAPNSEVQRLAAKGSERLAYLTRQLRRRARTAADQEPTVLEFGIVVHGPEYDEEVRLPDAVARATIEAMEHVANGYAVAVVPLEKELTTTRVARLLNVSRPYAARLMDEGEIPSHKVGTHRRAYYADVMAYKRRMDQSADEAYAQMVALTEELGLYEG